MIFREEDIFVSMQTLTPQEEGACVETEMSGGQALPSCRTTNLNPPRLTPRRSQRRLPLEFMDGLSYTTIIEPAEPLARRRGSALDR